MNDGINKGMATGTAAEKNDGINKGSAGKDDKRSWEKLQESMHEIPTIRIA
ncbi:MAG: hypothetical protein RQ746_11405 [Bacteroidales bacterium]|nr:hypothetical protein [Bacteroidales bacterium]